MTTNHLGTANTESPVHMSCAGESGTTLTLRTVDWYTLSEKARKQISIAKIPKDRMYSYEAYVAVLPDGIPTVRYQHDLVVTVATACGSTSSRWLPDRWIDEVLIMKEFCNIDGPKIKVPPQAESFLCEASDLCIA